MLSVLLDELHHLVEIPEITRATNNSIALPSVTHHVRELLLQLQDVVFDLRGGTWNCSGGCQWLLETSLLDGVDPRGKHLHIMFDRVQRLFEFIS